MTDQPHIESDDVVAAQKKVALSYLHEAWASAISEGVDSDILAHAALFAALSDLVATYGESAVAELTKRLPERIEAREFSLSQIVQ